MTCFNRNTAQWKAINAKYKNPIVVDSIMTKWQESNNTEALPSLQDVNTFLRQKEEAMSVDQNSYKNILLNNFSNRNLVTRVGDMYMVKPDQTKNTQKIYRLMKVWSVPPSSYSVKFMGDGLVLEIDASKFNKSNMILSRDNDAHSLDVIDHMLKMFPQLDIDVVSRQEARAYYDNLSEEQKELSYGSSFFNVKAYYVDNTVKIVKGSVSPETVAEEILHPFVNTVEAENNALYKNLLSEAKKIYPELLEQTQEIYKNYTQENLDREFLTKALSNNFNKEFEQEPTNTWKQRVMDLLKFIGNVVKNLFKYISGANLSVADIKSTSTISDITKLLNTKDLKFNLNDEVIKNTAVQFALSDNRSALITQINEEATDKQKDIVDRLTYASREAERNIENFTAADYIKQLEDPIVINVDGKYYNIDDVNDVSESVMDYMGVELDISQEGVTERSQDLNIIAEAVILNQDVDISKLKTINNEDYIKKIYEGLSERVRGYKEIGAVIVPNVVVADTKSKRASTISLLAIEENGDLTPINIFNDIGDAGIIETLKLNQNGAFSKLLPDGITRKMLFGIEASAQLRILQNKGYKTSDKAKTIIIKADGTVEAPISQDISNYTDYTDLIVKPLTRDRSVEDASENLSEELSKLSDEEIESNAYEAAAKDLSNREVFEGIATNKLRAKVLEDYRVEFINLQKATRAINSQKVLNDDGSVAAKTLKFIDINNSLISHGLEAGAFDLTYEKMLTNASKEIEKMADYINDPKKMVNYKDYLSALDFFGNFIDSFSSLADASASLEELNIEPNDIKFSDSENKLRDKVKRQLNKLMGTGKNKKSLLLEGKKSAIKLYIMNNTNNPFYSRESEKFDEAALDDLLNFIQDQTSTDYYLGTVAGSDNPLLALADQLFKSTKINGMNTVEKRIENEVLPLVQKLERLQPSTNILGQKRFVKDFFHYMYEFKENGDFTGNIVQKTDWKNYQAIWDRETKDTRDALGEPLEYIIKDASVLTDKDKAHNIKVHKAKVRAAKFYAPETVEKVDGVYTYRDGDYHKHTDAYKKARAEVAYFNTVSGKWQKKSDVSRYKYQKWRNKWKDKPDKDYQKMEYDFLGGGPTGVVEILPPKDFDRKVVDGELTRIPRDVSQNGDNLVNPKYKAIMEVDPNDQLGVAKKEFYLMYTKLMEEYLNMLPASAKQSFNGKSPLIFNKFFNNLSNEGSYFTRMYEKMGGWNFANKDARKKFAKSRLNPLKPTMAASSAFDKIAGVHIELPPIMYVGNAKDDNAIEKLYELKEELIVKRNNDEITSKEYKEEIEKIDQRIMLLEDAPTKNEMSLNAASNLIDFMAMANHYDNMSQIKGFLNSVQDIIDGAKYQPGGLVGNKGYTDLAAGIVPGVGTGRLYDPLEPGGASTEGLATKPASESKLPERYRTWMKNTFYRNIGKGRQEANMPKILNNFKFFTSFLYVGSSPIANFGNLVQGTNATWREAVGQNWVTRGSVARATKAYYATALPSLFAKLGHRSSYAWLTGAGRFDKMKAPNEYWASTDYWRMMDSYAEVAEIGRQRAQQAGVAESAANIAFALNNGVEYKVQTILGRSYLDTIKMQVRDKDGKVLEEKSLLNIGIFDSTTGEYKLDIAAEGGRFTHYMDTKNRTLSVTENGDQRIATPVQTKQQFEKFYAKIRNDIRELNIQAHGNYAYDDKTQLQASFLGELAMQFGKWVAPLGRAAYSPLYFDENLGWVEGRQRALGNFVAQIYKGTAKATFDAQNPDISLVRRRNAYKVLYDYLVIATSLALAAFLFGGDNPHDKGTFLRRFRYFARYSLRKLAKEVLFFTPFNLPDLITMKTTDPLPITRVIGEMVDVATSLHHIPYIQYAKYFDEDLLRKLKRDKRFFYQRGNKRGLPKYIKEIGDITPWAYSIQRWKNFDDETDVYTGNK
tara:strand:- start:14670 stop:20426 length:5757 start_codon:yes stop_codon:yes gene_type:complete